MTYAGRLTHIANAAAVLQMPNVLPRSHAEPQPILNDATAMEKMWKKLKALSTYNNLFIIAFLLYGMRKNL